jgi:hypothetical protein
MSNVQYATTSQVLETLKDQGYVFTQQQINTKVIKVNGYDYRMRPGIINEIRDMADEYFKENAARRVKAALERVVFFSGKGSGPVTRERLLQERTRCYVVNKNGYTHVPTAAFFQLAHASKVTVNFNKDGTITLHPHK